MKTSVQNRPRESALVVWTWRSKIGQSVANLLKENFDVIHTSKDTDDFSQLDIVNIESIDKFIDRYIDTYGRKPLNTVFLNSWYMNIGDSLKRGNFFGRANDWDPEINAHLNNIVLLESLSRAGIVTPETKVIYNASVQVFDGKEWYEDYAMMKKIVTTLVLEYQRWDATVLCLSLVEGTGMAETFKEKLNANGNDWFKKFVEKNMPYGQPTLSDIDHAVELILSHKEETKCKIIFIDGWSLGRNKPEVIKNDFLFYDRTTNSLVSYKDKL